MACCKWTAKSLVHDQLWHLHDRSINFDVTFLSIHLRHHICYMTLRDWPKVSIALMNAFKAMTSGWLSSWTLIFGPGRFLPLFTVHNWMRQKHDTLLKILIHVAHVIQCDEALFWKTYYKKKIWRILLCRSEKLAKMETKETLATEDWYFVFFPSHRGRFDLTGTYIHFEKNDWNHKDPRTHGHPSKNHGAGRQDLQFSDLDLPLRTSECLGLTKCDFAAALRHVILHKKFCRSELNGKVW